MKLVKDSLNNISPINKYNLYKMIEKYASIFSRESSNNDEYQNRVIDLINETLKSCTKVSINDRGEQGDTLLTVMIKLDDIKVAEYLIDKGIDINQSDKNGYSPIILSIMGNHNGSNDKLIQLLLDKEVILTTPDNKGNYPIFYALEYFNAPVYFESLKIFKMINVYNKYGESLLMKIIKAGDKTVLKEFMSHRPDLHHVDNDGNDILDYAYKTGNEEIINYIKDVLEENKFDKKISYIKKNNSSKALKQSNHFISAIEGGNKKIIQEMIINDHVEINKIIKSETTPLMMAIICNHNDIVEMLINHGANVNRYNSNFTNMLSFRHIKNSNVSFKHLYPVNLNPILTACEVGNTEALKILIKNGADLKVSCHDSRTPLISTILKNFQETAEVLLKNSVDINETDKDGYSALAYASMCNNISMVNKLVDAGANINPLKATEIPSILCAVRNGFMDIVKILISHGANIDINNNDHTDLSLISIAVKNNHLKLAEYLKEIQNFNNNYKINNKNENLSNDNNFKKITYMFKR